MIPSVLLVEQWPHTHSLSLKPSNSAKKEAGYGSRLCILWLCNRLDHYQQNWMPPAGNRNGEFESKVFFTFCIKDGQFERRKKLPAIKSWPYQRRLHVSEKLHNKYYCHIYHSVLFLPWHKSFPICCVMQKKYLAQTNINNLRSLIEPHGFHAPKMNDHVPTGCRRRVWILTYLQRESVLLTYNLFICPQPVHVDILHICHISVFSSCSNNL